MINSKEKVNGTIILGTYYYMNGDRYNGNWKNGKRDGKGKQNNNIIGILYYSNKERYEGEFINDIIEGRGCLHIN